MKELKTEQLLVRLVSGEEIVGDVTLGTDSLTIQNGFNLLPGGEGKIAFIPFMAYTEAHKGVTINNKHVLFTVKPVGQLADQVNQMSGKGPSIQVPNKDIIVPK